MEQAKLLFTLTMVPVLLCEMQGQQLSVDVVVAKDGSGDFTSISDAIIAAPNNSSTRYCIMVKDGTYEENIIISENKINLALLGQGMDTTIILGNRSYYGGFNTSKTATVGIQGQGFIAYGITFENIAGPEMEQAVALEVDSIYAAFYKCRFRGYQDTLYTRSGVQFFRECEIIGTVDIIFGNAKVVFQNCIIYVRRPLQWQTNVITAQGRLQKMEDTGTVMQNCTITAMPELRQQELGVKTYLGRPWKKYSRTVIIWSYLDDFIDPKGWLVWDDGRHYRPYYAEYKNRGPGADIYERVVWARVINSSKVVAQFTVRNFIYGDMWLPLTGIPHFLDVL